MDDGEKIKIINGAIATLAIPAVIAFVGNQYSLSIQEREIQGEYVELAVNIHSEPPEEKSEAVRKWAVDIINKYSGVTMSAGAKENLVKKLVLPNIPVKSVSEAIDDVLKREGGLVSGIRPGEDTVIFRTY